MTKNGPWSPDENLRRRVRNSGATILWRHGLSVLLILTWLVTLWWGERWIFEHGVGSCAWQEWEEWVSQTQALPLASLGMLILHERAPKQIRTMFSSSQTLNSSIHIPILAVPGHCPH